MTPVVTKPQATAERVPVFWGRVPERPEDGCWLYAGPLDANGYGLFWNGHATTTAHRVAYELTVGAIPDDLNLDQPVTHAENMRRSVLRRPRCRAGHLYAEVGFYIYARGVRRCKACERRWRGVA